MAGACPVVVAVLFIQGIYTYLRLRLGASTATPSPRLGCHALAAAPAARSYSSGALRRRGRVGERGTAQSTTSPHKLTQAARQHHNLCGCLRNEDALTRRSSAAQEHATTSKMRLLAALLASCVAADVSVATLGTSGIVCTMAGAVKYEGWSQQRCRRIEHDDPAVRKQMIGECFRCILDGARVKNKIQNDIHNMFAQIKADDTTANCDTAADTFFDDKETFSQAEKAAWKAVCLEKYGGVLGPEDLAAPIPYHLDGASAGGVAFGHWSKKNGSWWAWLVKYRDFLIDVGILFGGCAIFRWLCEKTLEKRERDYPAHPVGAAPGAPHQIRALLLVIAIILGLIAVIFLIMAVVKIVKITTFGRPSRGEL